MGPLRHNHRKLRYRMPEIPRSRFRFLVRPRLSTLLRASMRPRPSRLSPSVPSKPHTGLRSSFFFSTFREPWTFHSSSLDQALDRLVLTSFRITALTPSTYQPCCLQGVLPAFAVGYFFLRGASRLDAFSVYPVRTSLPCYAVGTTTVAPEVRPFRSSRTRNSSSHVSYAHDG